jgi:hypothetical protein
MRLAEIKWTGVSVSLNNYGIEWANFYFSVVIGGDMRKVPFDDHFAPLRRQRRDALDVMKVRISQYFHEKW